jgi:hypothetical protein
VRAQQEKYDDARTPTGLDQQAGGGDPQTGGTEIRGCNHSTKTFGSEGASIGHTTTSAIAHTETGRFVATRGTRAPSRTETSSAA